MSNTPGIVRVTLGYRGWFRPRNCISYFVSEAAHDLFQPRWARVDPSSPRPRVESFLAADARTCRSNEFSARLLCLTCAYFYSLLPRQGMDLDRVYEETDAASQRSQNTRPPSVKSGALPLTNKSLLHRFKVGLWLRTRVIKLFNTRTSSLALSSLEFVGIKAPGSSYLIQSSKHDKSTMFHICMQPGMHRDAGKERRDVEWNEA